MPELATNLLCCGDNLDILRRYLPDATDAQLMAFEDTWHAWSIGRGDRPARRDALPQNTTG
ncbi:MAG: hypothetical protein WED12_06820 [Chloroflexota bacterium]